MVKRIAKIIKNTHSGRNKTITEETPSNIQNWPKTGYVFAKGNAFNGLLSLRIMRTHTGVSS